MTKWQQQQQRTDRHLLALQLASTELSLKAHTRKYPDVQAKFLTFEKVLNDIKDLSLNADLVQLAKDSLPAFDKLREEYKESIEAS